MFHKKKHFYSITHFNTYQYRGDGEDEKELYIYIYESSLFSPPLSPKTKESNQ